MTDPQPVPAPSPSPAGTTPAVATPAVATPAVATPAAPVAASGTPSAGAVEPVPVEPAKKKRRALGVAALIFALLALAIDILTLIFGFGSISQFSDGNLGTGLTLFVGSIGWGFAAVVVGAILAGVAFVLSIGAMIGGSGRVTGVVAFLISLGELILHAIAIAFIVAAVTAIAGMLQNVGGGVPLDQIPGLDQMPQFPRLS